MHLFVDANTLLSFYGLSPAQLEELRKLLALIRSGELILWVPDNLADEVQRNRPKVLAEAVKALKESRLKVVFPLVSEGLPERNGLESAVQEAQRKHSALVTAIEEKALARELEADELIRDLFAVAQHVPTTNLITLARERRDLRRPPGKADSLGDALNWEALLAHVPPSEDIHLISGDSDFRSPLRQGGLHEYLGDEWMKKKQGGARLYSDLGAFSSEHFPELRLATDIQKMGAIRALAGSSSFADTHVAVARLSAFDIFTPEQARLIVQAATENSQVRWIASDADVSALLGRILEAHRDRLDRSLVAILEALMYPPRPAEGDDVDDEDLPF